MFTQNETKKCPIYTVHGLEVLCLVRVFEILEPEDFTARFRKV